MTEAAHAKQWDHSVDLLVVGSGAGAMTAALVARDRGAAVLVVEKTDRYGGSSAMSGGTLWVPNNPLMAQSGVADSPEDAMTYLRGTTRGATSEERLRTYVDEAPRMLRYVSERSPLQFQSLPSYVDYYPHVAGSRPGARSIEACAFDARRLGDEFLRLREPHVQTLIMGRIAMTTREARELLCRNPGWIRLTCKLMARYWLDLPWRFRSRRDRNLTMGNALAGGLRRALMDREVPLWLETPARSLVVEDGRVVGAQVERQGRPLRIRAERGVILAAGGFESSDEMREKHLPGPTKAAWTVGSPGNVGDAIRMGAEVGAALELMDEAWWGPTTVVPGEDRARMLVIEKGLPGCILVNRRGERIVNEAAPYIDIVNAMYGKNTPEAPSVPAYMVFDATYRGKYPFGPILQSSQQPDWALPKAWKQGYLRKAPSLEGLAAQLGVDPEGLKATAARMGDYARTGEDLEFQRGGNPFDRYYGDDKVQPNPCLGPLEKPPFYGIEVFPGDLGTKGGLQTDARARVLNEAGAPIPGLYALGNCSASIMGRTYPGAGSTLGPSMTFGYLAARDAIRT